MCPFLSAWWVTNMSFDVQKKWLDWIGLDWLLVWGGKADFLPWPLMTWAAICTQLCARRDLGPPYIYHHSRRVMTQASQGQAAEGPDIFIFLLRSLSDLPTHGLGWCWPDLLILCFSYTYSPEVHLYLPPNSRITFHSLRWKRLRTVLFLVCLCWYVKMSPAVTVNSLTDFSMLSWHCVVFWICSWGGFKGLEVKKWDWYNWPLRINIILN